MRRGVEDVFFKDWFIHLVGGFLSFHDLSRWDVAMSSSQREKWLKSLSNVKIPKIDEYHHTHNETIRWLISRRIQHVTKIRFSKKDRSPICGRTFTNASILTNLKSIIAVSSIFDSFSITDSYLASFKVNCRNLEEVKIECDGVGNSLSFVAAADMVQKLPRLRCFTFTRDDNCMNDVAEGSSIEQSSTPLLLALAQYCPLLESLHLAKYNDEGLAELVAGCPKLHTLTINADTHQVSLAGFRALGRSRSITTLNINTYVIDNVGQALRSMADEGMPIKTLELYTSSNLPDVSLEEAFPFVVRFARTLENLKIRNLAYILDSDLEILSQCHNLRSINIENLEPCDYGYLYGEVTGAFLNPISVGCPLLEEVFVSVIKHSYNPNDPDEDDPEPPTFKVPNCTHFFENCPNLKHFNLEIRTDEEIKALAQHCPLIEGVNLGSSDRTIKQEDSEISDVSLVAMAQNLHFLKSITLNHTQCTDAGLLALAKGQCGRILKHLYIENGSWKDGYPEMITQENFDAILDMCPWFCATPRSFEFTNNVVSFYK